LQLVIKDAFEECGQPIQKVIAKVSEVVSHVRKSVFASEVLEDENRLLLSLNKKCSILKGFENFTNFT
jgi:cell shape-determining protein MreC